MCTYGRRAVEDCIKRHEVPLVTDKLYEDIKRIIGHKQAIDAILLWRQRAEKTVVYIDHGITSAMRHIIASAEKADQPVEYRRLSIDTGFSHLPCAAGRQTTISDGCEQKEI